MFVYGLASEPVFVKIDQRSDAPLPLPTVVDRPCKGSGVSLGLIGHHPLGSRSSGRTSSASTTQCTPRNLFGFKAGPANVKTEDGPKVLNATCGFSRQPIRIRWLTAPILWHVESICGFKKWAHRVSPAHRLRSVAVPPGVTRPGRFIGDALFGLQSFGCKNNDGKNPNHEQSLSERVAEDSSRPVVSSHRDSCSRAEPGRRSAKRLCDDRKRCGPSGWLSVFRADFLRANLVGLASARQSFPRASTVSWQT